MVSSGNELVRVELQFYERISKRSYFVNTWYVKVDDVVENLGAVGKLVGKTKKKRGYWCETWLLPRNVKLVKVTIYANGSRWNEMVLSLDDVRNRYQEICKQLKR